MKLIFVSSWKRSSEPVRCKSSWVSADCSELQFYKSRVSCRFKENINVTELIFRLQLSLQSFKVKNPEISHSFTAPTVNDFTFLFLLTSSSVCVSLSLFFLLHMNHLCRKTWGRNQFQQQSQTQVSLLTFLSLRFSLTFLSLGLLTELWILDLLSLFLETFSSCVFSVVSNWVHQEPDTDAVIGPSICSRWHFFSGRSPSHAVSWRLTASDGGVSVNHDGSMWAQCFPALMKVCGEDVEAQ